MNPIVSATFTGSALSWVFAAPLYASTTMTWLNDPMTLKPIDVNGLVKASGHMIIIDDHSSPQESGPFLYLNHDAGSSPLTSR
jgi:uncharacterized protein (DUF2062 family)